MTGSERTSKRDWYACGGFANPCCWRRRQNNRGWVYYYRHD